MNDKPIFDLIGPADRFTSPPNASSSVIATEGGLQEFIAHYSPPLPAINEIIDGRFKAHIARVLAKDPQGCAALVKTLGSWGITKVKPIAAGASAVIFDTIYDQMVRITYRPLESQNPYLPEVLQPLFRQDVGDYAIEIVPRVEVAKASPKSDAEKERDRDALITSLAQKHQDGKRYWFYDCYHGNFGYLKDGSPIVLDRGAVATEEEVLGPKSGAQGIPQLPELRTTGGSYLGCFALHTLPKYKGVYAPHGFTVRQEDLDEAVRSYRNLQQAPLPPWDFAEEQAKHNRTLGLAPGNLRGVMPPELLAQFRQPRREMLEQAAACRDELLAKAKATPDALTSEEREQLSRSFIPSPNEPSAFDSLIDASGGYPAVAGQIAQRAMDTYPDPRHTLGGTLHRLLSPKEWPKTHDKRGLCERLKDEQRKALDPSNGRS